MTRNYQPWTSADEGALRAHVADGKLAPEIARLLGRNVSSVRNKIGHLHLSVRQAAEARQRAVTGDEPAIASPLRASPVTLDELLATFGLNAAEWDVIECTPNVWQIGAKHPDTGEILTAPLYQLKARLKRKATASHEHLKAALLADIRADAELRPRVRFRRVAAPIADGHAAEFDLFDLHVGKMSWSAETGSDYDSNIAYEDARATLTDLLGQAAIYPLEEIMLPLGNDFFHSDTLAGATTAGTRMDVDTRFQLMFRRGRGLASWMIAQCADIAPVYVPIIPGNHDEQTAFLLGEVLAAEFAHDPRVTIDNSPKLRKYHVYGRNLVGWSPTGSCRRSWPSSRRRRGRGRSAATSTSAISTSRRRRSRSRSTTRRG